MPVPSSIADLSQTPNSNYPTGSESPITTDNYLREYAAYIAQLRDGKNFTDPVTLESATTTDIGAQNSLFVEITGTTTITGFGTTYNGPRFLRFTGILILTHNATTLNLPGGTNITTAAGDTAIAVPNSTLNGWNIFNFFRASGLPILSTVGLAASGANSDITSMSGLTTALSTGQGGTGSKVGPVLAGHIFGLTLSTAGSSTTMSIAAGQAADSAAVELLKLAAGISKTTSAWAVGTGNGGKAQAGAAANNTTYHFYLIRRPDTGVVDICFSTNATGLAADDYVAGGGNIPAAYTQFRRIFSWLTNGSAQWVLVVQDGDRAMYAGGVLDVDILNDSTSAVSRTLSVPAGIRVEAIMNVFQDSVGSATDVYISDPSLTDNPPSESVAPLSTIIAKVTGATDFKAAQVRCFTNTSRQIRTRHSNADGASHFRIVTLGWIDSRGRNA